MLTEAAIFADVTDTARLLKVTKKTKTSKGKTPADTDSVKYIKLLPPGSKAPGKLFEIQGFDIKFLTTAPVGDALKDIVLKIASMQLTINEPNYDIPFAVEVSYCD